MLRILFNSDDIARTRLVPAPDPLWELVMSLHMLRPQAGDLLFRQWRLVAGAAVRRAGLGERLQLLLALTPPLGYFPDFLNPIAAIHGLDEGLDAIRSTPKTNLARDLRRLAPSRPLPDGARQLADGRTDALAALTATMRTCYHQMITPYRRAIDAAVAYDRQIRINALATGGVEAMLASLSPMMHWSGSELSIPTHRDQELDLDGRGLLLIPAYFCLLGPVTMLDPALPPVVVYPIDKQPDTLTGHSDPTPLDALIGPTRAAILEAIATRPDSTTTGIARHIGAGASSASEHAAVLRQAGLITSHRDRNRMLHLPTPLGLALLGAGPCLAPPRAGPDTPRHRSPASA